MSRPDGQFGDFATNIAMQLAKSQGKNPRELAEQLAGALRQDDMFADVTIAGPGFINLRVSDTVLTENLQAIMQSAGDYGRQDTYKDKVVIAEYSDPNPFKVLHAGHLYAIDDEVAKADIIFEPKESVSIHGNSGPYLQYAHARAMSIVAKLGDGQHMAPTDFDLQERTLLVKMTEYPEVLANATKELSPHLVCTYLYELAQTFNRFYEQSHVIDDPRQDVRGQLVRSYATILRSGLTLLGIQAPDTM